MQHTKLGVIKKQEVVYKGAEEVKGGVSLLDTQTQPESL